MSNANIGALAFNPQNMVVPQIYGGVIGATVGTGSGQVIGQDPQRQRITFANPGDTNIIYVCPSVDANGNALTAGKNPGNYPIFPGGFLTLTGEGVGLAWLAAAAGAGSPLTIAASQLVN